MDQVADRGASPPAGTVRQRLLRRGAGGPGGAAGITGNLAARVLALVGVAAATVVVARLGGAVDVGLFTLLRVLPGIVGVVAACGLPGSLGYVVGRDQEADRLWPTLLTLLGIGCVAGAALWLVVVLPLHAVLLPSAGPAVALAAGVTVVTQLPVASSKAAVQALGDTRRANILTAAEELVLLPVLLGLAVLGMRGAWLLVMSLLVADVLVAALGARFVVASAPTPVRVGRWDRHLAGTVLRFGARNQVGGIIGLLNLRLDVVIIAALTGPAAVGVYAVASKAAEVLRLPGLAIAWVGYPQVAARGGAWYAARARTAIPPLLLGAAAFAAVGAVLVHPVIPLVYGDDLSAAGWPASVIILGLAAGPAGATGTAYLLGTGQPGRNSAVLGVGLALTVALDWLLIPAHGVMGAAVASAVAYLATDLVLVRLVWRARASGGATGGPDLSDPGVSGPDVSTAT